MFANTCSRVAVQAFVLARQTSRVPSLAVVSTAGTTACQRMSLFTNAKKDYTSQSTPADKKSENFFDKKVEDEKDIPAGHAVEKQLPSHKQLVDELPSASEIEKAIREGKIDAYKVEQDKDE